MFRHSRQTQRPIEDTLRGLPSGFVVYVVEGTYVVVGTTGVFVIAENSIDLHAAAAAAAIGAHRLRSELADALPFVPFVDAIAVGSCATPSDLPALIVPHDMVESTIVGGPTVIDWSTLESLQHLSYPVLY
ncbi:MAG: hypothetical protein M9952_03060 [Microthrixaceae bacterium]|nr:hypothetical protein [Microthrixaceae bacterium]MCO5311897.1 hypothetical protein [Microthrixaceae bacterium]HPB44931.1 hypothetical protein [Microthrixaceae bacterium]